MRVVITGSRHWTDSGAIRVALDTLNPNSDLVIVGDATGADALARGICRELGIACVVADAHWERYGRPAGPRRNKTMLDLGPDEVWYFHKAIDISRGTKNCVLQATSRSIKVARKG